MQEVGYAGGEDEEMWGSTGGGGVSEGEEGGRGGASTTTAPEPHPKAKPHPNPPNPPPRNESFLLSRPTRVKRGDPPSQKAPPPHHRTAYEGGPRPQTHQPPQDRHCQPPPPPKNDTPKGAEKKDDRPEDPIVGTVIHVSYPTGVERGTALGIHGRKYGAVWVEYPGGTTLYEVARPLLFSTVEEAEGHREQDRGAAKKKAKPPAPANEESNPPNANPTTEPTNITHPTNPTNPHPDPRRCGTPLRGPMRYEGPDRDPMGHNVYGQHT